MHQGAVGGGTWAPPVGTVVHTDDPPPPWVTCAYRIPPSPFLALQPPSPARSPLPLCPYHPRPVRGSWVPSRPLEGHPSLCGPRPRGRSQVGVARGASAQRPRTACKGLGGGLVPLRHPPTLKRGTRGRGARTHPLAKAPNKQPSGPYRWLRPHGNGVRPVPLSGEGPVPCRVAGNCPNCPDGETPRAAMGATRGANTTWK